MYSYLCTHHFIIYEFIYVTLGSQTSNSSVNSDSSVGSGETCKQAAAAYSKSNGKNNHKKTNHKKSLNDNDHNNNDNNNDDFDIDKNDDENNNNNNNYDTSQTYRSEGPRSTHYSVINKAALDMLNSASERSVTCDGPYDDSDNNNYQHSNDIVNDNEMKSDDDDDDQVRILTIFLPFFFPYFFLSFLPWLPCHTPSLPSFLPYFLL